MICPRDLLMYSYEQANLMHYFEKKKYYHNGTSVNIEDSQLNSVCNAIGWELIDRYIHMIINAYKLLKDGTLIRKEYNCAINLLIFKMYTEMNK